MARKKPKYKVLLVDDDERVQRGLEIQLGETYDIVTAASGEEALEAVKADSLIAVVVMDIKMPNTDGIQASRAIREQRPDIYIIFHTGFPGLYVEDDIDASESPFGYVQKCGPVSQLTREVRNAMDLYIAKHERPESSGFSGPTFDMIGKSAEMQAVFRKIRKVAPTETKVMILGETGTGKELVARALHSHSERSDEPLVVFNCNHKSLDLAESELFGHVKGAFTGAIADRVGIFEQGDRGTVFLDEIGDLDITTQAKILRVLETGEFLRLGESPPWRTTDVRILCATHHDLEKMVADGTFREDLYYRLKGATIRMPPLRERKEDIPLLVSAFINRLTLKRNRLPKVIDQSAMRVILDYNWPGNVRHLLETIEAIVTLADSGIVTSDDVTRQLEINSSVANTDDSSSLAEQMKEFKRTIIIAALHECNYNISAAARLLQVDPSNLRKWINQYGINLGD